MKHIQKMGLAFFVGFLLVGNMSAMQGVFPAALSEIQRVQDIQASCLHNGQQISVQKLIELINYLAITENAAGQKSEQINIQKLIALVNHEVSLHNGPLAQQINTQQQKHTVFDVLNKIREALPGFGVVLKGCTVLGAAVLILCYLGYLFAHAGKIWGEGPIVRDLSPWLAGLGVGLDLTLIYCALSVIGLVMAQAKNVQEGAARLGNGLKYVLLGAVLMLVQNRYC